MASAFHTTKTAVPANALEPDVAQLPFVCRRPGPDGVNFWNPSEEGDWDQQCRRGRKYAEEFVDYVQAADDVPLLAAIVQTIVARGSFGGVEVGFVSTLSERLVCFG